MKVVVLGLTFVSVLAFKLVISVEGENTILNENEVDFDKIDSATEQSLNISDFIDSGLRNGTETSGLSESDGDSRNESSISGINNNSTITNDNKTEEKSFRLPNSVIPISYKLEALHILDDVEAFESQGNASESGSGGTAFDNRFKRFTSPGKVWVEIEVLETTNNVTLHAEDLRIELAQLKNLFTNRTINVSQIQKDNDTHFLVLNFDNELFPGRYEVYIEFVSRIADDRLNGLYLDYYFEPKTKQKRFLATTLFAPNHARKAFPCFDEPALRATFDITIGRLERMTGWVWDHFAKTPSMSAYLVAMITCDFKAQQSMYINNDLSNTTIRVFAPDYLMGYSKSSWSTNYSVDIMEKVIPYFGEYFESEFPLKKISAISLPHFYFSAMENWGMITFKDPVLISIENVTTESERNRISEVVVHELSHQWFGNLVAVKYWTYVWLKEGFSTYYSYLGTELTHPELHPWIHFTTDSLQIAMKYDESLETHPLENEPKSTAAVGDIYTKIPYEKGASILRMTSAFLTSPVFHKGIKLYIQRMKYKAATQDDLFQALQDVDKSEEVLMSQNLVSSIKIKDILDTWTKQDGFPIVRVKIDSDRGLLQLSQEKFINPFVSEMKKLENLTESNSTKEDPSWWIPITLSPKISINQSLGGDDAYYTDVWIPKYEQEIFVDYKHTNDLFLVNPDTIGYYRVLYDDPVVFTRIQEQLISNHSALSPVSRSQILDDYFAFAFAKYVPIETALNLTRYLNKETELVVWTSVLTNLRKPYELLQSSKSFYGLKNYVLQLLVPAWKSSLSQLMDLQDITEKTRLQSLLFRSVCQYEPEICADVAKKHFKNWVKDPSNNPIPADDQGTIYCVIVRTVSAEKLNETWNFFANLYHSEYFSVQKSRYLKALTCGQSIDLLKQVLSWTTDETKDLHDVERVQILQSVAENLLGKELVLTFLDENFHSLYKDVSAANPLTEGIRGLIPFMNSKEDLKPLEDFISKYSEEFGAKKKSMEKLVNKVKLNIRWVETFADQIKSWVDRELEVSITMKLRFWH